MAAVGWGKMGRACGWRVEGGLGGAVVVGIDVRRKYAY
jgi:hypothetical protein